MFKSISAVIILSSIAITSAAYPALSDYRPCYSMPKSGVPCIIVPAAPQLPKPQGF
jgi:hypothetical protein